MSPTPRRRPPAPPAPFPETGLAELGLTRGDPVRFRRHDGERWKPATVARRERDGSVGLHDQKGASRSIPVDRIEVRTSGPRGGVVWEPLATRAARTEQVPLVPPPTRSRRRPSAPERDGHDTNRPDRPDRPDGPDRVDRDSHDPGSDDPGSDDPGPDDPGPDGQLSLL